MPDAILRLVPDPVLRLWTEVAEVARRRDIQRAVLVFAILLAAGVFLREILSIYRGDAFIYWSSIRNPQLYLTGPADAPHGYLYAPAFVQILWPLLSLPWELFYGIWLVLMIAALLWMARPTVACLLFLTVFVTFGIEPLLVTRHALSSGNVALFMGLAVAAGFRWPSAYALLILTKVTPAVGLLWFLVRREWRNLAIALGTTAAIALVSFCFAPNLWFDWFTVLKNNSGYPEPAFAYHFLPLMPRLVLAAAMTVVAARYNARWVVPIAATLAMPYIWTAGLVMLVGAVPLLRQDAWTESRVKRTADKTGAPSPAPAA